MSKPRHYRHRDECEQTWPELYSLLAGYLHQDWDIDYGTIENAMSTAITEAPIEHLQRARQQLTAMLSEIDDDTSLRAALQDGFSVNIVFRPPSKARELAERFETKMADKIERHYANIRKLEWKRKS